jgi:hypothetical protein
MLYDLADSFFADVKALHVKRYMVVGDFYLVIEDIVGGGVLALRCI